MCGRDAQLTGLFCCCHLQVAALAAVAALGVRLFAQGEAYGATGVLRVALVVAAGALLPTAVAPTVDVLVERRVYLASAALYPALVALVMQYCGAARSWKRAAVAALPLVALLCVFVRVTANRNAVFSSEEGVWREVLQQYPQSVRGRNNLAALLLRQGQHDEAQAVLETLVVERPSDAIALDNLADAVYKQGGLWSGGRCGGCACCSHRAVCVFR